MRSNSLASVLFSAAVVIHIPQMANAWDPWKDITGKRLKDTVRQWGRDIRNAPGSVTRCVSNLDDCAEEQIRRIPYTAIWPIIERYKQHLFNQANGRYRNLPENLIVSLQPHYPQFNLRSVVYAENINTVHGRAITWENRIFFPYSINLNDRNNLWTMLHELEHVVQYNLKGGYQGLISQYILKAGGKIIERQTFDPHDFIDMERAADSKANILIGLASSVMQQNRDGFPGNPPVAIQPRALGVTCTTYRGVCAAPPSPFGSGCSCRDMFGVVDPGQVR
jgi:Domain of unknown function (DUF4157)